MSYDLMVFDPDAAPSGRKDFMDWYFRQTKWTEEHGYNDSNVPTLALQSWYSEMISEYPNMNGPGVSDDDDSPKFTDYSLGKTMIYAAFAWSECKAAYSTMFKLAGKHKVGFFDVSATNGEVWVPASSGKYVCIHGGRKWWQFWKGNS
jgi:hypothetical protein